MLAGLSTGSWNIDGVVSADFAAMKLDANRTVEWRWQVKQELNSSGLCVSLNHGE